MRQLKSERVYSRRGYGKSQFQRNLGTTIRNLVMKAWISLPWVSYLPAYAVLLFGSDHYGPIGNKQMSSSAWQSTMMNNHGAADLWESQETYVTDTKSHMSAGEINMLFLWPSANLQKHWTSDVEYDDVAALGVISFKRPKISLQWKTGISVLCAWEIWICEVLLCLKRSF